MGGGRGLGGRKHSVFFLCYFYQKGKDLKYNLTEVLKQEKETWVAGGCSNQGFSVLRAQVSSQLHWLGMQILKPSPRLSAWGAFAFVLMHLYLVTWRIPALHRGECESW